jgi:hypothetical protein
MRPGNANIIGGFPARKFAKLKYVEQFTLDPGSATDTRVYRLNGMYDPRVATGGNQPSNYDIWTSVYNKWAVTRCDVKVTPVNSGPEQTGSETGLWGFMISQTGNDIGSSTPFRQIAEQPYARFSYQTPGMKNSPYTSLTASIPVWEWLGMKKRDDVLSEENYQGTINADPSRQIYMEVFYTDPTGSTVTDPAYFIVELEYHAWFFLPRETTASFFATSKPQPQEGPQPKRVESKEAENLRFQIDDVEDEVEDVKARLQAKERALYALEKEVERLKAEVAPPKTPLVEGAKTGWF